MRTKKTLVENDYRFGWECYPLTLRHGWSSVCYGIAVVDYGANVEINHDYRYLLSPVCRPHPLHVFGFPVPSEFAPLSGRPRAHVAVCARLYSRSASQVQGERRVASVGVQGECSELEHLVCLASQWRTIRTRRAHRKAVRLRSTCII